MQRTTPRWAKWSHVPYVKVWEAVALSLDVEPASVEINEYSWMSGQLQFQESEEFKDRVFVVARNLNSGLTPKTLVRGDPASCTLALSDFAAWAVSINWTIPEQLKALAKKSAPSDSRVSDAGTPALEGKGRTTALKLILGMALVGYGYDPTSERSKTPTEIAEDLALRGISVTDDTVRKWLKDAASEIEWHPLKNS